MLRSVAVVCISIWLAAAIPAAAAPESGPAAPSQRLVGDGQVVMRSLDLCLKLATKPFGFALVENRTGRTLLSQAGETSFTVRGKTYRVAGVSEVLAVDGGIRATLMLRAGRAERSSRSGATASGGGVQAPTAHAQWSFSGADVLVVTLSLDPTAPPSVELRPPSRDGSTQSPGGTGRPCLIREEFRDAGEHVYGLWEYPFGRNLDNRGIDAGMLPVGLRPGVRWCNARAPFYITSHGYGVYVETSSPGRHWVAVRGRTGFEYECESLTYRVIYGPRYEDILFRFNEFAGPPVMPPLWALGSIWWRDDPHAGPGGRSPGGAQAVIFDDMRELRRHRIAASAYLLDRPYGTGWAGWGNFDLDEGFPDPRRMVAEARALGYEFVFWVANRCRGRSLAEARPRGFLFRPHWGWWAVDLRNPEGRRWLVDRLRTFADLGVAGFKVDRGDEGEVPRSVVNVCAALMAEAAAEALGGGGGRQAFVMSRNLYDTGRRYSAVWSGDPASDFRGLAVSIKNALRCGLMGFPTWGSDTGGYTGRPDKEVLARWLWTSTFSPLMEVLIGPGRTPWRDYDDELLGIAREAARTHHDLIPYMRSLLYEATVTGMPAMRPLFLSWPDDPALHDMWDEFMLGPWLLVAPVTTRGARTRPVYLPQGKWLDYNDRRTCYEGGGRVTAPAPLGRIPLFVKEGAVIPRGDILKGNNCWTPEWAPRLRVEVFPGREGSGGFAYFDGTRRRLLRWGWEKQGREPRTLVVTCDDVGIPVELEVYCRDATGVIRNGAELSAARGDYVDDASQGRLVIPVDGASVVRILGARSLFASAP